MGNYDFALGIGEKSVEAGIFTAVKSFLFLSFFLLFYFILQKLKKTAGPRRDWPGLGL